MINIMNVGISDDIHKLSTFLFLSPVAIILYGSWYDFIQNSNLTSARIERLHLVI